MNYFRCSCLINLKQCLIWNPPTDRFSNQALSYQIQHPHQHRHHFFLHSNSEKFLNSKKIYFPNFEKLKKKDFIVKSNVEKWVIQGKLFFFYKNFRDILPGKFGNSQCKHCWRIHSVCSAQANCCWGEFLKKLQFYPICKFLENFWNLIKKFCKNSNVINQSKCSSGILEHGTKCQTTCDDIRHEMICSCWRIFGPIQDCFHSRRINKK